MSDISESSDGTWDDTDVDPDYEEVNPESESEMEEPSSFESRHKKSMEQIRKNVKDGYLRFKAMHALDLSESDSSDDTTPKPYQRPKESSVSKSEYFSEVTNTDCKSTNYDFSHILASQSRISEARKRHTTDMYGIPDRLAGLDEDIAELLALGENTDVLQNSSSSDTEEEENDDAPQENVIQITLENPAKGKTVKGGKQMSCLEKQLQIVNKKTQLQLHKVHLLCLIAHGNYVNSTLVNNDGIYGCMLSLLPEDYAPPINLTLAYIKRLLTWFGKQFQITRNIPRFENISVDHLESIITTKENYSIKDLVVLFVSLLRGLGLTARVVMSLQPVSIRPKIIQKKKKTKKGSKQKDSESLMKVEPKNVTEISSKTDDNKAGKKIDVSKSSAEESKKSSHDKAGPSRGADGNSSGQKGSKRPVKSSSKAKSTKKLPKVMLPGYDESSEDEKQTSGINFWAEVYIESEETWYCVDLYSSKTNCPAEIYARCAKPVTYIIGWKNDNTLRDVTRRYVPAFHTVTKKNRVDQDWFDESIKYFHGPETALDKLEKKKLDRHNTEMLTPIPTKLAYLKNHPLYALKRHLLKFEAIYPPDAVPMGYVRGEAVYSRYCVQTLFSREKWIRRGKCVRVNETPYKIVKSRPKANTMFESERRLELFGPWQVDDYIPPPVIDNKIPRNEYGNIEVYKPSMVPVGAVHLRVPGIPRIAKKMNIDAVPAVIGWEHHGGRSHPIIEGVVVCKEYQDLLLDAWCAETDASAQRSDHRRKQSSLKKWQTFVKLQLIRADLKRKYNFGEVASNEDGDDHPKRAKKN